MSDRLDDRIRGLYAELTDAAPDVPPLLSPSEAPWPIFRRPMLALAASAAAIVVVLGVSVAVVTQLELGGGDDAAPVQAPVTRAPAATAASGPPATQPDHEDEPTATFAPSAGAVDPPGRPRPVEHILLLGELNRACSRAADSIASDVPGDLDSEDDYRLAFVALFNALESVRAVVEAADPDFTDGTGSRCSATRLPASRSSSRSCRRGACFPQSRGTPRERSRVSHRPWS